MRESGVRWLWQMMLRSLPRLSRRSALGSDRAVAVASVALIVAGCVSTGCAAGLPAAAAAHVGFGLALGALLASTALLSGALLRRSGFDAGAAGASVLLALWTVVATAWTLPVSAARWIAFGDGLGWLALALAVLVRRVLSTERVVHVLEVRELRTR